jgi:hypothetical protein
MVVELGKLLASGAPTPRPYAATASTWPTVVGACIPEANPAVCQPHRPMAPPPRLAPWW